MESVKRVLDAVKMNGSTGNTSAMAEDIASYELLLALVSDLIM